MNVENLILAKNNLLLVLRNLEDQKIEDPNVNIKEIESSCKQIVSAINDYIAGKLQ